MATPSCRNGRPDRVIGALALAAFLAAGPGLSGLEVAYHLASGGGAGHGPGVHYEEAGQASHGDHCHLSLSTASGRLPCGDDGRVPEAVLTRRAASRPAGAPTPPGRSRLALPRAPPALPLG